MPVPLFIRRAPAILGLLLGLCAQAFADDAPRPGAAGDGGHLWLAAPAPKAADGWRLLHRDPVQKEEASALPHGMWPPVALPDGSPAICARGGVFYAAGRTPEGAIQLTQWRVGEPTLEGVSLTRRSLGMLSADVAVRAMAADRRGLWLAVVAVPAKVLKREEVLSDEARAADGLALALRMPPGVLPKPASAAPKIPAPSPEALPSEPRLMLLRAEGGAIRPLATTLPPAAHAWLASDGEQVLLATEPRQLWRVTPEGLAPQGDPGPFTHLLFAGRTALLAEVAAEHALEKGAAWRDTLRARWSVWNPAANPKRVPNGECSLPLEPGDGHGVVEWAGQPALVRVASSFKPSQPAASVAPVDLHGVAQPAFTVFEARDRQQAQLGVTLLQLGVTAVAISLMVWSWRRGARLLPKLPQTLARAGMLRRAMAAVVDLALAVAPVAVLSGVPARVILREWPFIGEPASLADMRLGFLAGGLFIAHTMLSEGLAGRSIGKALAGIEVVGLDGKRAPAWRIVVRGLLKWLELLSPALSILAVFSPFGQRLGDLAAGTVVVRVVKE